MDNLKNCRNDKAQLPCINDTQIENGEHNFEQIKQFGDFLKGNNCNKEICRVKNENLSEPIIEKILNSASFPSDNYLKDHIEYVHCNTNESGTNQKQDLTYPLKSHKCHFCDYAVSRKEKLKRHIDCVHLNLRQHKCHLCDYAGNRKDKLQRHIECVHLNLKKHKCPLCEYAGNRKDKLQAHIDTVHLNLKSHKCFVCEYSTNQKLELQCHIDQFHLMKQKG